MFKYGYRCIEVLKVETKTTRGEFIIRSIVYNTREKAEEKMKTLQPKENGILKIEKMLIS